MNIARYWYRLKTSAKKPIVFIGGTTASGKTSASLYIAQQLQKQGVNCEIISADSRQIYREIPIFSGAVSELEMDNIPHHLVGTESITSVQSAGWFRDQCTKIIRQIHNRESVPIIVGGSAFWLQSLLFIDDYPQVPPNETLRKQLETKTILELQQILQQLDPKRFANIDIDNPRRLIRSIEIATQLGSVPKMKYTPSAQYSSHMVYIDLDMDTIRTRITKNVHKRFQQGLVNEAHKVSQLLSKKQMVEMGLAYKYIHSLWQGDITESQLQEKTITEEVRYAKRQKTFFKKIIAHYWGHVYTIDDTAQKKTALDRLISDIKRRY